MVMAMQYIFNTAHNQYSKIDNHPCCHSTGGGNDIAPAPEKENRDIPLGRRLHRLLSRGMTFYANMKT